MVRQAKIEDLADVAKIHMACFPGTVTSSLGKLWNGKIVVDYYKEYFNDCPELFLVAENDSGEVVGFCMGYKIENEGIHDKRLIRHNLTLILFSFLLLLLKGDKDCWRKVKSLLKRNRDTVECLTVIEPKVKQFSDADKIELFTIGILDVYRGQYYGKELILRYFEVCRRIGRKICLISYINANIRAERFYYKNGCKPYLENGNNNKICYKEL